MMNMINKKNVQTKRIVAVLAKNGAIMQKIKCIFLILTTVLLICPSSASINYQTHDISWDGGYKGIPWGPLPLGGLQVDSPFNPKLYIGDESWPNEQRISAIQKLVNQHRSETGCYKCGYGGEWEILRGLRRCSFGLIQTPYGHEQTKIERDSEKLCKEQNKRDKERIDTFLKEFEDSSKKYSPKVLKGIELSPHARPLGEVYVTITDASIDSLPRVWGDSAYKRWKNGSYNQHILDTPELESELERYSTAERKIILAFLEDTKEIKLKYHFDQCGSNLNAVLAILRGEKSLHILNDDDYYAELFEQVKGLPNCRQMIMYLRWKMKQKYLDIFNSEHSESFFSGSPQEFQQIFQRLRNSDEAIEITSPAWNLEQITYLPGEGTGQIRYISELQNGNIFVVARLVKLSSDHPYVDSGGRSHSRGYLEFATIVSPRDLYLTDYKCQSYKLKDRIYQRTGHFRNLWHLIKSAGHNTNSIVGRTLTEWFTEIETVSGSRSSLFFTCDNELYAAIDLNLDKPNSSNEIIQLTDKIISKTGTRPLVRYMPKEDRVCLKWEGEQGSLSLIFEGKVQNNSGISEQIEKSGHFVNDQFTVDGVQWKVESFAQKKILLSSVVDPKFTNGTFIVVCFLATNVGSKPIDIGSQPRVRDLSGREFAPIDFPEPYLQGIFSNGQTISNKILQPGVQQRFFAVYEIPTIDNGLEFMTPIHNATQETVLLASIGGAFAESGIYSSNEEPWDVIDIETIPEVGNYYILRAGHLFIEAQLEAEELAAQEAEAIKRKKHAIEEKSSSELEDLLD